MFKLRLEQDFTNESLHELRHVVIFPFVGTLQLVYGCIKPGFAVDN